LRSIGIAPISVITQDGVQESDLDKLMGYARAASCGCGCGCWHGQYGLSVPWAGRGHCALGSTLQSILLQPLRHAERRIHASVTVSLYAHRRCTGCTVGCEVTEL
jgi:hypothetical protein